LVMGGFTVCDIPGYHVDHRSMMEEPAVKVLAGELRRELRRLEAGE
jgi:thioesterase domain-containing protein